LDGLEQRKEKLELLCSRSHLHVMLSVRYPIVEGSTFYWGHPLHFGQMAHNSEKNDLVEESLSDW
jgi:hypothetical protein